MDQFSLSVTGLWVAGSVYAVHFIALRFWSSTTIVRVARIPLGILAWVGAAACLLPAYGFVRSLIAFAEHPNLGSLGAVGVYFFILLLLGFLYQYQNAFESDRVLPLLLDSLFFRHSVRVKNDIFASLELHERMAGKQGETDRAILSRGTETGRTRVDREKELRELTHERKKRMDDAGKEENEHLTKGIQTDITEVFRMFYLHGSPHPGIHNTFRVVIDPLSRRCELSTLFPSVKIDRLRENDAWFRFRQEMFDIIQVFLSDAWTGRFRPFFDAVTLTCYQEEQDSFGLPRKSAFVRGTLPVSVVDAHRGRIFIATEFEKVGTIVWIEERSGL